MVTVIEASNMIQAGRHQTTQEAAEYAIREVSKITGFKFDNLKGMTSIGRHEGVNVHFFEETDAPDGLVFVG